ncbi:hypothetical protein [Clostridium sp. MD294]|nr:hypothetical protein [Clostridium sp. MD294]USF30972.1 hypothetical protein C820_002418 [Clostridium sp. MD294]
MYCFGKDFTNETEIKSLLEEYLKNKKIENNAEYHNTENQQKLRTALY